MEIIRLNIKFQAKKRAMKIIAQGWIVFRLKREESHDNKNNLEVNYGRRIASNM
jgi:hypothetical protein